MNSFSIDKFKKLAQINEPHSLNIYIPTHGAGKEINEKVDQIHLKNQVQKVAKELEARQLDNKRIETLIVKNLENQNSFIIYF